MNTEWIDVKTALPESNQRCLVVADGVVMIANYEGGFGFIIEDDQNWPDCVTKWMPLPKI